MAVEIGTPTVDELADVVGVLGEWQADGAPMQLHPGDIGWFWRFGMDTTAAAVRTWSRAGEILATGLLDLPTLLRMTIAPTARQDVELAQRLVEDLSEPERGVLVEGQGYVESPVDALLRPLLAEAGWRDDELWSPLRRDLSLPSRIPAYASRWSGQSWCQRGPRCSELRSSRRTPPPASSACP